MPQARTQARLTGRRALLCLLPAALLALGPDVRALPPASLVIRVENVSRRGGNLRVALYTRASWDDDEAAPVIDAVVPAAAPETVVTLTGVAPGSYGVKMFQDANRNGKFDQSWLGLPEERFGFSNDARPGFSEPGFDAARIVLAPGRNVITVHLQ